MIPTLLVSFIYTVIMGAITVNILKRRKVRQVERLDGPQTHLSKIGTPTMGGIICVITLVTFYLIYMGFNIYNIKESFGLITSVTLSTLLIAGVGFIDDFLKVEKQNTKGLKGKYKIIFVSIISAILMYYLVYVLNIGSDIKLPFSNVFEITRAFKVIFGVIVIIATTNAVNLTDGIDGLASSVGIVIMAFLSGVALKFSQTHLGILLSIIIGSYLGFLLFNWHKAKVFMGDTGSFFLGAVIAICAIILKLELFLLLIAIIPVIEALSVIIQVVYFKKTKKRIFKMAPIHHHFEASNWSELRVVSVFTGITIIACILSKILM